MTTTTREALKQALEEITEVAMRVDGWESFPSGPIEKAQAAIAAADAEEAKPTVKDSLTDGAKPAPEPVVPTILINALQKISRWHDEFPATGKTWELSGNPMSYAACYGSNGERDYMRQVALDALASFASLPAPVDAQIDRDAERYRYLRDDARKLYITTGDLTSDGDGPDVPAGLAGSMADAAIDAAIAAQPAKSEQRG